MFSPSIKRSGCACGNSRYSRLVAFDEMIVGMSFSEEVSDRSAQYVTVT